jgi:nucleoid-associated protein YgaU
MFVRAHIFAFLIAVALVVVALGWARPSQGASPEGRHVVRPGDTLWSIAVAHYAGDPRAAVWRIEERNGLSGSLLEPGTVLYLPR